MRVILLAWLLLAAAAASAPAQSLPDPGSAGSHEAFLRTLADGKARIARDILARYDQRLARDPSNATAALERCLFLRASFADRNGADRSRYRAEQRTCTDELAARFPV